MKKIAIIGGGAGGIFTAANLGKMVAGKAEVVVFEKSGKLLTKVRVSGGGRCNVTHACFETREFVKNYPRGSKELKSPLSRFQAGDTMGWFEERGVSLKIEDDNRVFPVSDNSQTIIDCLKGELEKYNVQVRYNQKLNDIKKLFEGYQLQFDSGGTFNCDYLVIATGGGNAMYHYLNLSELNHEIIPPVPSLFTFKVNDPKLHDLMGQVAPYALTRIPGIKAEELGPLLITHWGFSGPAILKLSAWGAVELEQLQYRFKVMINWIGEKNEELVRQELMELKQQHPNKTLLNGIDFPLSKKLKAYIIEKSEVDGQMKLGELPKKAMNKFINTLLNDVYEVDGQTKFKEEFVTAGGVSRKELNFQTMESKLNKNVYFVGEVVDVDGITGGFNFQNAWSSAFSAATDIANKLTS